MKRRSLVIEDEKTEDEKRPKMKTARTHNCDRGRWSLPDGDPLRDFVRGLRASLASAASALAVGPPRRVVTRAGAWYSAGGCTRSGSSTRGISAVVEPLECMPELSCGGCSLCHVGSRVQPRDGCSDRRAGECRDAIAPGEEGECMSVYRLFDALAVVTVAPRDSKKCSNHSGTGEVLRGKSSRLEL
eukprot:3376131-Pleurochrysis_carterae.AAC.2